MADAVGTAAFIPSDHELMRRTAAGDRAAFAALYERHAVAAKLIELRKNLEARAGSGGDPIAGPPPQARKQVTFLPAPATAGDGAFKVFNGSLGSKVIEGVKADGARTTTTIPAGAVGNVVPIHIVSERWFSRELQMPVLITRNDPRSGETIYRLTSIVRAEPADALFTVPPGYDIRDGALSFRILEKAKVFELLPKK
jgi:hypothetical protein